MDWSELVANVYTSLIKFIDFLAREGISPVLLLGPRSWEEGCRKCSHDKSFSAVPVEIGNNLVLAAPATSMGHSGPGDFSRPFLRLVSANGQQGDAPGS
jgi:hypothetical protein